MKKKLLISIVVLLLGCGNLFAQNDGFFTSSIEEYREDKNEWGVMPSIPGFHGFSDDYEAVPETPISGGLLLLAGMGIAYGIRKRKKE